MASCGTDPYEDFGLGAYYGVYRVDGADLGDLTLLYERNQADGYSGYDFLAQSGTTYAFQCGWQSGESNDYHQQYGPLVTQLPRAVDVDSTGNAHGAITVTGPQGSFVIGASVAEVSSGDLPPGVVDLSGALSYTIGGLTAGSTIQVTVELPEGSAPSAAYKRVGGDYVDVTNLASFNGDTVTLTLTDGGSGDSDGAENGTIVDPLVLTRPGLRPGVPRIVSAKPAATAGSSGSLVVAFKPPKNNGGLKITKYTATCTSTNGGLRRIASRSKSPITVTGATTGKSYRCSVKASNSKGYGPAAIAPAVVVGAPGRPGSVKIAKSGAGSVTVTFARPVGNGAPITSYAATCTSTNGGKPKTQTAPSNVSGIGVSGLTVGKTYRCTVVAKNSRGSGRASAASNSVKV
jgi:hypothetical protein